MTHINLSSLVLSIFFSLISITFIYSQQLVEQNKIWAYYTFLGNTGGDPGVDHPLGGTEMYTYGELEVIDNLSYHPLLAGFEFTPDGNWSSTDLRMREDSLGRVYMKEGDLQEVLIYDFSLEINDVFYDVIHNCNQVLVSKDSISLNSGNLWEQFTFDSGATWIKGIGSTASIIPTCYGPGGLVCFQMDDNLDYTGELYAETDGTCYFVPVNVTETAQTSISIFPNPVQHSFTIQSEEKPLDGLLIITNAMGQNVYKRNITDTLSEEVDLSTYPAGVYYLNFGRIKQKLVKVH